MVMVSQGGRWSCCTPTLLDVQVMGNVARHYSSVCCDLCYVPQSTGYLLGQSDQS